RRSSDLLRDRAGFNERIQSFQCLRRTELLVAAAKDELLGLRKQLDVADAAAAEFDVKYRIAELCALMRGKNLALDRMNVFDGGEVEMLAPDEGRQGVQEFGAGDPITRRCARLDERGALPILTEALVVMFRGGDRDGNRRRARVRP